MKPEIKQGRITELCQMFLIVESLAKKLSTDEKKIMFEALCDFQHKGQEPVFENERLNTTWEEMREFMESLSG